MHTRNINIKHGEPRRESDPARHHFADPPSPVQLPESNQRNSPAGIAPHKDLTKVRFLLQFSPHDRRLRHPPLQTCVLMLQCIIAQHRSRE
jgi:hypothetical protein